VTTKVLVVDDEAHIVNIVKFNLKREGYEIITASDGEEAFTKIGKELPDLVIADVMMPKMSGYELCEKVKTTEATKHIPFILITAKGQPLDKDRGAKIGADSYMTKPFSPKLLVDEVRKFLK
jgi:DNA-binding response OmpR family regulator